MSLKSDILNCAATKPDILRQMLRDSKVAAALEALGIQLTIFELHAQSASSRVRHGLGPTLCNYRGRRHPTVVTCKKCLAKLNANS